MTFRTIDSVAVGAAFAITSVAIYTVLKEWADKMREKQNGR